MHRLKETILSASLFALALVLSFGCLGPNVASAGSAESRPDDPNVVAEVGGQPVTREELEAHLAGPLRQLETQRHQMLEGGLARLTEERLLTVEAERRDLTVEALLAAEVDGKVAAVTDAEVDAWYAENQARVRQPKEAVAPQIRAYLQQERQQAARREVLAGLRERHGVRVYLEPLRLEVAVDDAPVKGPAEAPVTLVEFSDFQCPACQRINPVIEEVRKAYGDKVRVAFRQLPLHSIHPQAQKAAEASLCARDQGKFWEMHDSLFARQRELGVDDLKARAGELGLDAAKFSQCLDSEQYKDEVMADVEAATQLGLSGTPSLFVNGRPVDLVGATQPPFELLSGLIDEELRRGGRG